MSVAKNVCEFVDAVSTLRFEDAFNPYFDRYDPFDLDDAPQIRKSNLQSVLLAAAAKGVDDLWVALELGHKGGRRTGLAMTDDTNLLAHGERFGVAGSLRAATKAGPVKELTAGCVWKSLSRIDRSVFLWNVVPVHTHKPEQPLSNRRHTRREREFCIPILSNLIELIQPARIVCIGNDASVALAKLGYEHTRVRHPARGGQREFLEGINGLL